MAKKPYQTIVLNDALSADVDLEQGMLDILDTTAVAGESGLAAESKIKITDGVSVVKKAYSAGVPQVNDYAATTALAANTEYSLSIEFPNAPSAESNQLYAIKTYTYTSGTAVPTAANVADGIAARVALDSEAKATVVNAGGGAIKITQKDVADGLMNTSESNLGALTLTTAYTAPAGTAALVEVDAPTYSMAGANYTTWDITVLIPRRHNAVSGGFVYYEELARVYANNGTGTGLVAFTTALDAVLDGTHATVADFLGMPA
tara:strand:- start:723 stop:1508 length:786 start_codon:yes stop_codon:yes gene_type:complete